MKDEEVKFEEIERLKTKDEGSTHLVYTGFRGGLEHLKIQNMNVGVMKD
jgi:hypothetical protein